MANAAVEFGGTVIVMPVVALSAVEEMTMTALLPEELGGGFTRAGLPTTEMSQWQMERTPT